MSSTQKIVMRMSLIVLVLSGGLIAIKAIRPGEAHAASTLNYTVDPVAAAGGVFARYGPHTNDTFRTYGYGVWPNETVQLLCGVTDGDPVGPYANHTWHFVTDLNNPTEGNFWLNDHYIDSPNVANHLAPGESKCKDESNNPFALPEPWQIPTRSVHDRIDHVVWVNTPDGESLHVYVTKAGYLSSRIFPVYAFNEVMYDGHIPFSASMYNQFVCHALAAPPQKQSWNLDVWRPTVSLERTIKDHCNPQPGEVE